MTAKPRGVCPVCRKDRALRRDGTLGSHGICKGAGLRPLTDRYGIGGQSPRLPTLREITAREQHTEQQ